MMSGLFITIDGLDGTGKSTLVNNLAEALGAEAWATPGKAMASYREGALTALGPDQTARAVFYAATVVSQGHQALAAAAEGRVVVMDRYWLSTLAYARARGCTEDLLALQSLLPRPHLSLVVTLDEATRQERMQSRGTFTEADAETLKPAFRSTVLEHFGNANAQAFAPLAWVDVTGKTKGDCLAVAIQTVRGQLEGLDPS